MRRTVFALGSLLTVSLGVGCAPPEDSAPEQQEQAPEPGAQIYYGDNDTANDAVVFLYSNQGYACSGTIIAKNGGTAYVLTAAHCDGMDYVIQDDDISCAFNNPNACDNIWDVSSQVVHPNYNGNAGDGYDFSIITITGASSAPVIPVTTTPDGVGMNSQVTIVGYGETETGESSDVRQQITMPVAQVYSLFLEFDQEDGGACHGDSGGPAIFNGKVVGVTSFGGDSCAGNGAFGYDGRVAAVYNWIAGITGAAVVENCDTCFADEVQSQGGQCAPQVDACLGNNACNSLAACIGECTTNACVQGCANDSTQAAIDMYNAIFDCWCVACATLCSDECDSGNTTTSTGNGLPTGPSSTTGVSTGAGGGGAPVIVGGGAPNGSGGGSGNEGGADAVEDGGGDGCGCATVGAPERSSSLGLLGLALASVVVARRRRRA